MFFKKPNMMIAAQLADYAIQVFKEGFFPENVREMVIQALIDQYGLQIGGSEFAWSKALLNTAKKSAETGKSSVTRYGLQLSPLQAAFVNSAFAQAQDFEDSHQKMPIQPGSVVIPAAIALAEELGLCGEITLMAMIVGMEVTLRLAHSLSPACLEGEYHTSLIVGPFGAAIACGLLLGLTPKQLTLALRICDSHTERLIEAPQIVKRIHTALAARIGLEAALLAKESLIRSGMITQEEKGLGGIFGGGRVVPERLFEQIGQCYMLSTLMLTPYNCCYFIHPAIQLFLEICARNHLSSKQIKSVAVSLNQLPISYVGNMAPPKNALSAQCNVSFTLALSLIKGPPVMHSYQQKNLSDPKILELAKKIVVCEDLEVQPEFPKKNGCVMHIDTQEGKVFHGRINNPKGSLENLLTAQDIKRKFLENTRAVIGEERASAFYEMLRHFPSLHNVRELNLSHPPQIKVKAKL